MDGSLSDDLLKTIRARLQAVNAEIAQGYPVDSGARQPVHTVYGGADLFRADTPTRLGARALRSMDEYAPDWVTFARAIGLPGGEDLPSSPSVRHALEERLANSEPRVSPAIRLAHLVHARVRRKLEIEPVEDYRIDFEDGFGYRTEEEEDRWAVRAAEEVARGAAEGSLPPFIGVRIKAFGGDTHDRAIRTLDLFLSTLATRTDGKIPRPFLVTLPKVYHPGQVTALADILDAIESAQSLEPSQLQVEIMVETTPSLIGPKGEISLASLTRAARGRCVGAHFGVYDFTASCGVTATHQRMNHPACEHARHLMQMALAGTPVWLSDGATNILPIPRHRGEPLTSSQKEENREAVHSAWRVHYQDVRHSLTRAFYQGWDLHPAQLPTRYGALYSFFLEELDSAAVRLSNFVDQAAQATLIGDIFDDAATGQGLLNLFLRGLNCGALTEEEARRSGLTRDELRTRSFTQILEKRRSGDA